MARLQTPTSVIKPLKPFRRGETLGKASRAAKPSGVFGKLGTKVGLNGPPAGAAAPGEGAKKKKNKKSKGKGKKAVDAPVVEKEGDVAAEDEAEGEQEEGSGEETGDEGVEPAPVPKKKKVFIESQVREVTCMGGDGKR